MSTNLPLLLGALYGGSELALTLSHRAKGSARREDRASLLLLWIVISLSIAAAIWLSSARPRSPAMLELRTLGVAVFAAGLALRWVAIRHLGRFFTVDVAIARDHRVVDDGPYRRIRHPSYAGALAAFAGYGIVLGNGAALAAVTLPVLLAFAWRMHVEEAALLAALGDDYARYRARTWRLVPHVY